MKFWSRFWLAWLLVSILFVLPGSSTGSQAGSLRQGEAAQQKAAEMLARMTPEERIGQLFLITFQGSTFDQTAQIYDLIANHHIGGVVLQRSNDNFGDTSSPVQQTYQLTQLLQQSEWSSSRMSIVDPDTGLSFTPQYIPMLVGISQEGDQYPTDQIISGLTALPNLMAIGATWNPTLARQAGAVMGQELAALGINLYLGPSLDVLDTPIQEDGEDLGVRVFGGDPYWVGKLGQAYIAGLHEGSGSRMAVIPKHFPGLGSSDRSPNEEIPTVRKTLDQLQETEFAPFLAVTGSASPDEMLADGLLVSHVRYQGLQGNIRATTRPVSSDGAALEQILQLPAVSQWRADGGLLISDNLGSQAIRRFYDPTGGSFDARMVAREAFLAGNDLLYVDRFISTYDPDTYTTLLRTLDSFGQKYREDIAFAQRVDASVLRILTLKYQLYPTFEINSVVAPQAGLQEVGQGQQVTFDVARRAITLISPSASDLQNLLPRPPEARERIIFLTDLQPGRQCSTCAEQITMPVDAFQNAVLRLYGPRAGGLVSQNLMSSYSFADLGKFLSGSPPAAEQTDASPLENDLKIADWVVVSMLNPSRSNPDSMAFQQLLSQRPDLLRNKRVIVFAFSAPYHLDATDISKLTAYYAVYGKTDPFVEAAARILFQEQPAATGALPVSVPGVGYDLQQATSPDPNQVIPLLFDVGGQEQSLATPASGTLEPTAAPIFKVEDVIPLRTGVIYDRNHNPVPDGTPVSFVFSMLTNTGSTQTQVDTETFDGIARTSYRIKHPGILEIHAVSGNNARSLLLRLDTVTGGITQVAPTPMPTETPQPTSTPTTTPTITPTATPTPEPVSVEFKDWFFGLTMIIIGAVGVSYLGIRQAIARWGLRWALCGAIGGLLAYNYVALGLPGSQALLDQSGTAGVLVVTFAGITLGWGIGWLWKQFALPVGRTGDRSTGERPVTGPRSQSG